jgi:AraC-like DNA-binding protein
MAAPRHVPALRLTRDVIHIVNAEFATDLTLSDVAARLSVSPQHLSTVFSEPVGMTFRDYLGDRRLRFAASLLASGEANVTEACMWSGYRNLSHFGRAFRKRFGVPPRQYRESTL